ncbi:MAG: hypothetical protein ABH871_04750 [Pseudomonadota bacterium]
MRKQEGQLNQIIMKEILAGSDVETSEAGPAVLSCGGMYIPHRGQRQDVLYQIITTHKSDEPVKVVTGSRPKNVLYEVLLKESMN